MQCQTINWCLIIYSFFLEIFIFHSMQFSTYSFWLRLLVESKHGAIQFYTTVSTVYICQLLKTLNLEIHDLPRTSFLSLSRSPFSESVRGASQWNVRGQQVKPGGQVCRICNRPFRSQWWRENKLENKLYWDKPNEYRPEQDSSATSYWNWRNFISERNSAWQGETRNKQTNKQKTITFEQKNFMHIVENTWWT